MPIARPITDAGIAALIAEAHRLGLLDGNADFTGGGPMPGSKLGQIELVVDGQTYSLTGNPDANIVCMVTGSGFKDPHSVEQMISASDCLLISLEEFENLGHLRAGTS